MVDEKKLKFPYISMEQNEMIRNDIITIYEHMTDDESKQIFENRLLFSLTEDWEYIRKIMHISNGYHYIDDIFLENRYDNVYIYGAGVSGSRIPLLYNEYKWSGYIDKNVKDIAHNNIPVFGIDKCANLEKNDAILISNMSNVDEIKSFLIGCGINSSNIYSFKEYTSEKMKNIYFDTSCIKVADIQNKCFVDGGAFDGNDTINYYKFVKNMTAGAYLYEADSKNAIMIHEKLKDYSNVVINNKGLSDDKGQLTFESGKGEMSNVSKDGKTIIDMVDLDSEISHLPIGYIKLDVEGYEYKSLCGAKKIISEQKPCLAVSVYHTREDIFRIPQLLLELNPNYEFYMRHYSLGTVDTVLYAR